MAQRLRFSKAEASAGASRAACATVAAASTRARSLHSWKRWPVSGVVEGAGAGCQGDGERRRRGPARVKLLLSARARRKDMG